MRPSLGSGVRYEIHSNGDGWAVHRDGECLVTLETKRAAFEEVTQAVNRALTNPEKIVIIVDGEAAQPSR